MNKIKIEYTGNRLCEKELLEASKDVVNQFEDAWNSRCAPLLKSEKAIIVTFLMEVASGHIKIK